ncbi:unnamed protein product [Ambrosiozyma monospora]|uniref:Unnamed protein product n=1 Tax=Ambrosiozyma monospora TaxID=43982 RepID=A0ACB5SXE3_AMBMO|nr:unnamed protein product [Ambrosiozyma monospora]
MICYVSTLWTLLDSAGLPDRKMTQPQSEDEEDTLLLTSMFHDPQDDQESKPKPGHITTYTPITSSLGLPTTIKINLIHSSPLYGHILTHACLYTAHYLEKHASTIVQDKTVLEVGAGGALPSVLCCLLGAKMVVCSDYPDYELVQNLKYNLNELNGVSRDKGRGVGYIWGNPYDVLLNALNCVDDEDENDEKENGSGSGNGGKVVVVKEGNGVRVDGERREKFDLIILSDVIFNHSEHYKLLQTCKDLIQPLRSDAKTKVKVPRSGGQILVAFSPHRPKLFNADMDFFTKAASDQFKFDVEFVELTMWEPLFKDDMDEGTRELRSRVYFYVLHPTW